MYEDDDDTSPIDEKEYQNFAEELEFEQNFYKIIAGSDQFEVIAIPDPDGTVMSPDQIKFIVEQCRKMNRPVVYRISNGKFAVVYNPDNMKFAIVPEDNPHGFKC